MITPSHGTTAVSKDLVVYIDGRPLIRDSLAAGLAAGMPEFDVWACGDSDEISDLEAERRRVALVLVNTGMQLCSHPDNAARLVQLARVLPDQRIAIISDLDNQEAVLAALTLGVRGFIPSTLKASVAVEAIRMVCAGGIYVPAHNLVDSMGVNGAMPVSAGAASMATAFTPRQTEILACLRRGLANKLIAYELQMCESTVKVHLRHIMRKLRATNRTQVVSMTLDITDPYWFP